MADFDNDQPVFIYGGPFLSKGKNYTKPFIDTIAPMNVPLQGIFKRSFAHESLRERYPILITKIIDQLARDDGITSSTGASKDDLTKAIESLSQLKNEMVTNKKMSNFKKESEDSEHWNKWIQDQDEPYYFTANWVFAECYIYRRIKESFEHIDKLSDFDPFQNQKESSFHQNLDAICQVADRVVAISEPGGEDKERKGQLALLMKLCLWSNKCDLSLTVGEKADTVVDPFLMVEKTGKKFMLADQSNKVADLILKTAKKKAAQLEKKPPAKARCSCDNIAKTVGWLDDDKQEDETRVPLDPKILADSCPAKAVGPDRTIVDIVCDNAGYELFTDLCLGHYLVNREIVEKVRFHLKGQPWFVSDVMRKDFNWLIQQCMGASYSKEAPVPENPEEGEPAGEPEMAVVLTSDNLQKLGSQFQEHLDDGKFEIHVDDFWVQPHLYKNMKAKDDYMYRKLQFPIAIIFKGDLNYRKLLGDKNWLYSTPFATSLEGFQPAPVAAIRTVKTEVMAGIPLKKWNQMQKQFAGDEHWMRKGNFGMIQLCKKKDKKFIPMPVKKMPCAQWGTPDCTGRDNCKPGFEPPPPPEEA